MKDFSIKIENMSFGYDESLIYENLNYEFKSNNIYLLKAESGSGKTTLLSLLSHGIKPNSGSIIYNNFTDSNNYFSYVFPEYMILNYLTGLEFLHLVSKDDNKINELIIKLGLEDIINKKTNLYSSGEIARLSIIRLILEDKPIMILDEPTAFLDEDNKVKAINLLIEYSKDKLIIITSHDYTNNDFINLVIDNHNLKQLNDYNLTINNKDYKRLETYIRKTLSFKQIILSSLKGIKYIPIKLVIYFLFSILTFSMINVLFSYNDVKESVLTELKDTYSYISSDYNDYAYQLVDYYYNGRNLNCIISKDNHFIINEEVYILNDNEIYLNRINSNFQTPYNAGVIDFEYSLLSLNLITEYISSNGITMRNTMITDISSILDENYLDFFNIDLLKRKSENLKDNEIILYINKTYELTFTSLFSNLINNEVNTSSILNSYTNTLYIKDIIYTDDIKNNTIEIEMSPSLASKMLDDSFNLSRYKLNEQRFIVTNHFYDLLDIYSLKSVNQSLQGYYSISTLYLLILISTLIILVLYLVLSLLMFIEIKRKLKNDILFFRMISYNRLSIFSIFSSIFLIIGSISLIISYIISGCLITPLNDIAHKEYFESDYTFFSFNFSPSILILLVVIGLYSYIYSYTSKNIIGNIKVNKE